MRKIMIKACEMYLEIGYLYSKTLLLLFSLVAISFSDAKMILYFADCAADDCLLDYVKLY